MKKKMNEEVSKKLDVLIKLTAASVIKGDKTQTESIIKLSNVGIGYKDISKIIGTSESYVALILSKNRKKKNQENMESNANEESPTKT